MEKVATRKAYGEAVTELGKIRKNVVVLDADLSASTQTKIFKKEFPERFFNVGVAEQNLMGTAAGLAHSGKIVYASTFAIFATGRAWEIVRQSIAYPMLNVKICPTHAGITVGEDGASHQTVEDIAIMRVIPGMRVVVPADATETKDVINKIADYNGPVFVRLSRAATPVIYGSDYPGFEFGKGHVIRDGKDITIFAIGLMVPNALEAATLLEKEGIDAAVVNMASIKPIDEDLIVEMAEKTGKVVTAEEHSVIGGLGSAVAEVLARRCPTPQRFIGIQDEFGQSGTASALLEHYKLMPKDIVATVKDFLK